MTTMTFRGFTFREARNGSIASYKKSSFTAVVSDDHSFQYSLLPRTDDGSRYIEIDNTGAGYRMTLDGQLIASGQLDMFAANLSWKGKTHTILGFDLPNGDTFFTGMGGSPLPNFASLSSFKKFAMEARLSDPSGPFGPGKTIFLKDFISKTLQTENDRLTLAEDTFTDGTPVATGAGNDRVTGNSGTNVIDLGAGNDNGNGGQGDDTVIGGDGNDRLNGGTDNDSLSGGLGNDKLAGDAGDDTLSGGAGNDELRGGGGDDLLDGGTGADSFIFDSEDGSFSAQIDGYETGEIIQLRRFGLDGDLPELVQQGEDVIIQLSETQTILVTQTTVDALSDSIMTLF